MSGEDIFELGAQELRSCTNGIAVLLQGVSILRKVDLFFVHMGDLASLEQIPDGLGALNLNGPVKNQQSTQATRGKGRTCPGWGRAVA